MQTHVKQHNSKL